MLLEDPAGDRPPSTSEQRPVLLSPRQHPAYPSAAGQRAGAGAGAAAGGADAGGWELLLPPLAIEGQILKGGQVLPLDLRPTPPSHHWTV